MRRISVICALGASMLACAAAVPAVAQVDARAVVPAVPKKMVRAAKRQRTAEATYAPQWRRSKNPPTRRRLKANRLHVSKRVRRRHRRAA